MAVALAVQQLKIVHAPPEVHIKVIAVPGSGKSTVLVHRVGYLMSCGINADEILTIMFNDSAVASFKDELSHLEFMSLPEVKTYHSYARKLGFYLENRGLKPKSKFIPNQNQYREFYKSSLIKFTPIQLQSRLEVKSAHTVTQFIRFVELCKSSLLPPEVVFKDFKFPIHLFVFVDVYLQAENLRQEQCIQFFSDLIYDLIILCRKNPDITKVVSNKHKVLLVDEYQDANAACHELIKLIAGNKAKVNVVGDDDQTIYDFTGANPKFLKEVIDEDFNSIKTFKLTYTYRYGHSVALLANNVISNNNYRIDKFCISGRPELNTKIGAALYDSLYLDIEQTDLMREITDYILGGGKYNDIAILVRNYSSTFSIELALLALGIPYFISKESKTVLHSLEVDLFIGIAKAISVDLEGAERRIGLERFLKFYLWLPDGVDLSFGANALIAGDLDAAIGYLGKFSSTLKEDSLCAIKRRMKAFNAVMRSRDKSLEYRLNRLIDNSGIHALLNRSKKVGSLSPAKRFEIIFKFILKLAENSLDLISTIEKLKLLASQSDENIGIQFSTLHKSKGLAWPFVILAHCEEGVCPSFECGTDPHQVEVERRLFYVGITRARVKLVFHIPKDDKLYKSLSRFDGFMSEVDYFNRGYASRFVYETNLLSATTIATEIYYHDNKSAISSTGNRTNYNKYLQALGLPYRISGLKDSL